MTYSGDTPFLHRLILGFGNDLSTDYPSKMALYVEDECFLPSLCDKITGRRTDVKIPFRTNIPETSLVFLNDVRCICPDATHMLTRCVESDLRKMAQKIINDKSPFEMEFLHRFEQNLSSRDAKRPVFQFTRTAKNAHCWNCWSGIVIWKWCLNCYRGQRGVEGMLNYHFNVSS